MAKRSKVRKSKDAKIKKALASNIEVEILRREINHGKEE
nr:MAG TPA: hypothetical protein [Microviridae sp.]